MKIMIVEDDSFTRKIISEMLVRNGIEVIECSNGEEALLNISKLTPEIIILDVKLPEKSGYSVCKAVRENSQICGNPIIIMLTGETEIEKVRDGFKIGADDYVKKPFDVEELFLRINSWSRRINKIEQIIKYKNIILDIENRNLFESDKPVAVSIKEFEVLRYLILNRGLVVSREKLMKEVWELEYYYGCKTVDMTIKRIKEKVESISSLIEPVSGIGYKLLK